MARRSRFWKMAETDERSDVSQVGQNEKGRQIGSPMKPRLKSLKSGAGSFALQIGHR
jgi:hypothetical protein